MKIITDARCTDYSSRGHPERPERISRSVEKLKSQTGLHLDWIEPAEAPEEDLLRAHTRRHLENIAGTHDFDADTPAHPGIADHARRSAGGALRALQFAMAGGPSFSLMRPPGHHATREQAMGFCYLNSVAVAALAAKAAGFRKVAVFDFDVHHGNGTENILLNEPGCAFFSIHQHPAYPGTGLADCGRNCFNYPVAPNTPRDEYRAVLAKALDDLKKHAPDMVAVSAGFDAYRGDPLADGTLEAEDFQWLGKSIRQLQVPAFSVLEGGYSTALPDLILAYLTGLNG